MLYCGVDIAKHNHEVCIVNEHGNTVLQLQIENSQAGFQKLEQNLSRLGIVPENAEFCLEATGHYWLALYCRMTEMGYKVNVINPIQSDALRNLYVRKTKTDRKDSLLLADLLRLGRVPKTSLASETVLKLQTLSRTRFEFIRQVGSLKNIEEQIQAIEEAINEVMEEFRISPETPYRHVLETIPGIGTVLAAAIIGELGDVNNFKNARSVVAFTGLDATVPSSGQFEGSRTHMSKRGSPVLRHSLWLAAVNARQRNPQLKEYYEKKLREGKHKLVANGAVARRIAHLVYAVWKA